MLPSGIGIGLLAEPIVLVVLGAKWEAAIPLVQVLGLNGILTVLLGTGHYLNLAVGMARSTSLVLGAHVAVTIPLVLWSVPDYGAQGAVVAMLVASLLITPFNYYLVSKAVNFGWVELRNLMWRPLVGGLVMSGVIITLQQQWPLPSGTPMQLAYAVVLAATGAVTYGATVYLLWRRGSDPDSGEAWMLERAAALVGLSPAQLGLR